MCVCVCAWVRVCVCVYVCISTLYIGFIPVPPTIRGIHELPEEVTVLVNKTTLLECHVDGHPAPKITWFKDNELVSRDGPHRILSNGRTLQVACLEILLYK